MCPLGWPSQALMVEQQWSALINYTTNEMKMSQYTQTHTHTNFSAEELKYVYVGYGYGDVKCRKLLRFAIETWRSQIFNTFSEKQMIWVIRINFKVLCSYSVTNCLIWVYFYISWGILGGISHKVDT